MQVYSKVADRVTALRMALWQKLLALLFNLLAVCRRFRWIHQSFRVDLTSNYWKTKGFWWEIKGSIEIVTASATYRRMPSRWRRPCLTEFPVSFLNLYATPFSHSVEKNHFWSVFFRVFFLNCTAFSVLSCTPSSKNLISVPHYNKSTGLPKSGKKNKRTGL